MAQGFVRDEVYREFAHLKEQEQKRNQEYWLLRESVKGNFRWPSDWPRHIPRIKDNLCKPVTERFVTYLMGKGFTYNVDRPNNIEFRTHAERTEKILRKLLKLAKADLQFDMGARTGSVLGRTVYKVYIKNPNTPFSHACFSYCQPDYFFGIPAGDDHLSEFSVVYYSYPLDVFEAKRVFGDRDYKTETQLDRLRRYPDKHEFNFFSNEQKDRRIPVLEVWSKDKYLLEVGGVEISNGPNPFRWQNTGEGFVPFVVIENTRNAGEGRGEADIAQGRVINEAINQLLSRKSYIVNRWLVPTLKWKGAPQNYAEIVSQTLGGGGAIPVRVDGELDFLAYDRPNPSVLELEQSLRAAFLETCGMSEIAMQGTVQGSINTGPALAAQFQPVLSTIEKKRKEWTYGIEALFAMLLEIQEQIGDSLALGQAVITNPDMQQSQFPEKSQYSDNGELQPLSGTDINGLREVTIAWPGVLPKDDYEAARLELEKASQGLQSFYTTLEKLGEEYPDDELARIRMENEDPRLKGEKVAEQMRAQAPLVNAQSGAMKNEMEMMQMMQQQQGQQQGQPDPNAPPPEPPTPEDLAANGDPNAMRQQYGQSAPGLDLGNGNQDPSLLFGPGGPR